MGVLNKQSKNISLVLLTQLESQLGEDLGRVNKELMAEQETQQGILLVYGYFSQKLDQFDL